MRDNLRTVNLPDLLNQTRITLDLSSYKPQSHGVVEAKLLDLVGTHAIPVARWFDLWWYLRALIPQWDRLSFTMQHQQQSNWCWAAVSTSVSLYYDASSTWTQCLVANAQLGRSDCCGSGAGGPCNVYGYLDQALTTVGHLSSVSGIASFSSVDGEVDAGRPLGIRVAWSGGGAHFLAIIGYLEDTPNWVAVDDPIYGKSDLTYDTLVSGGYQGSGTWTTSYFTQS